MSARGIRNNNPGNIRHSPTHWMGQADEQPDSAFVTFEKPLYGIRALYKILRTYQQKHGLKTITQIIHRWAPPVENNTDAYVAAVSKVCGVEPDAPIDIAANRALAVKLVSAIIHHENGSQPYSTAEISTAIDMA